MAEIALDKFGFFNYESGDDDTYEYDADEFSRILATIIPTGICHETGRFTGLCTIGQPNLTISAGNAFIDGRWCTNTSTITISTSSLSAGNYYIYFEIDTNNRSVLIKFDQNDPGDPYVIYKVVIGTSGRITSLVDRRTYIYNGSSTSSYPIVISDTAPSDVVALWFKPVNV